jgi:putative acetyltransferase
LNEITIRRIRAADNAAISKIIKETLTEFGANHPGTVFFDPSTDHLFELFMQKGSVYFIAEKDKVILGGAGIFPSDGLPAGTCELVKMYLVPAARGKGVGKSLIDHALDFAKSYPYSQVYIETMPELRKAMTVYEKFGFRYLDKPLGNTGHFGCQIWMLKEL